MELLPREGADRAVRWFPVDPCWVFHTLNAYDDGHRIVHLCRYDGVHDLSSLTGKGPLTLDRWTIAPMAGTVTRQCLDDRQQEFPRIDDRLPARPHRYGYSAAFGPLDPEAGRPNGEVADDAFAYAVLKHDLTAGTVQAHDFGTDAAAGEAVFAPSSASGL